MKSDIKIFPSLLACDMSKFQDEINRVEKIVDGIHYDVMDGDFVPNLSFGAPVLKCLNTSAPLGFDAHLMVSNPDVLLEDFAKAGASSLSVHVETCAHIHRTLQEINRLGMKAGVALNPATPYEVAYEAIKKSDFVLVMSVNPGFGGQKFLPEVLDKIRKIRENFPRKDIQVDGGITDETASLVIEAGANWLVSGSYLFSAKNISEAVASLHQ
jgi:ribulose-phosphate 3-epimerase